MNSSTLKHQAKLQEWAMTVQKCRTSGLPVRRWCREKEITAATYYRWERELQSIAGNAHEEESTMHLQNCLGAGRTGTGDFRPSQQEAIDLIIASYQLSPHKLKCPYKLRIICRRQDDFSLNKIGETL